MSASNGKLAVLIDPGRVPAFSSLLDDYPFPLLPLGTKPLIQHWLERLVEAGYRNVVIMVEHLPEKVRAFVDEGQRWGVEVNFVNIREGQEFKVQRSQINIEKVTSVFVAHLLAFPKEALISALLGASERFVGIDGHSSWVSQLSLSEEAPLAFLDASSISDVSSPLLYWQANMDLLSGKLVDPLPFGFEAESGVWVASNCKIGRNVRSISPLAIGESTILSKNVLVGPSVVLSEKCVLDEGAFVKDSVVLGRTFIGSHIAIDKMIVSGDMVYRVDSDVLLHINDIEILARQDSKRRSSDISERLVALMTLSLFFIPLLILATWKKIKGQPAFLEQTLYLEDGRDLNGYRQLRALSVNTLNVKHAAWRKLPWLWFVVADKMALVGSSPRDSESFEYPSWVTDAEEFIPGVISQADLNGADNISCEEIVVADVYQLAKGQVGFSLVLWLKWLLSLMKFN